MIRMSSRYPVYDWMEDERLQGERRSILLSILHCYYCIGDEVGGFRGTICTRLAVLCVSQLIDQPFREEECAFFDITMLS